jgi:hypothetical protein
MENGKTTPTIASVIRLAKGIGLDLIELAQELKFSAASKNPAPVKLDVVTNRETVDVYQWSLEHPQEFTELLRSVQEKVLESNNAHQSEPQSPSQEQDIDTVSAMMSYASRDENREILDGGTVTFVEMAKITLFLRREKKLRIIDFKEAQLSSRFINYIENLHQTDLLMSDIIALDNALDADGEIVLTAWEATRFWIGEIASEFSNVPAIDRERWKKSANALQALIAHIRYVSALNDEYQSRELFKLIERMTGIKFFGLIGLDARKLID